jgi:hypothetical protein
MEQLATTHSSLRWSREVAWTSVHPTSLLTRARGFNADNLFIPSTCLAIIDDNVMWLVLGSCVTTAQEDRVFAISARDISQRAHRAELNSMGPMAEFFTGAFLSFKNFHAEGLRLLSTPFVEKDSPQIIWKSAIADWEEKVSTASLRIIQNDNSDEARKADQARLQRIV